MKEADVQAAFEAYLLERGWDIQTEPADYADIRAKRGAELLVAEVKGVTRSAEVGVDTGYGQILRTMSRHPGASQFVFVASEHLRGKVLRVSPQVRRRLNLDVYLVDDLGAVTQVTD